MSDPPCSDQMIDNFRKTSKLKGHLPKSNGKATYVSEIINVQSLLNIRKNGSRRHHAHRTDEDRLIINVCGDRYETHRSTLELYPNTLLGNPHRRKYYYDSTRREYFFDRNRSCFEAILYFYQSRGRLRRPSYVPIDIFLEEVNYFELGPEALAQLRHAENIKEVRKVRLPKNRIRRHIWATMEYPAYSLVAKMVNIFSLLLILVSTISLAVESLPTYVNTVDLGCHSVRNRENQTVVDRGTLTNQTDESDDDVNEVYICNLYFSSPFFIIQAVCTAFFTIELLLRIISTPSLVDFIKNFMNWIDVLAVIPFYIILIIRLVGPEKEINVAGYIGLRVLRILRFLRIFKLYQILKGIKTLRVLGSTLKQSIPEFFMMIFILTLMSFLFGAAIFLAENDANGQVFDSIFKATYWGVITITSVGYGDISPVTNLGRIIACLCALFGAATIAVLVSVLVDRYQRVYARKLYIPEEIIDFHDFSDDENNDLGSKASFSGVRARSNGKLTGSDRKLKQNRTWKDRLGQISNHRVASKPEPLHIQTHDSVQVIIDYLHSQRTSIPDTLLRRLNSMIAEHHIQLTLRESETNFTSSDHVQFRISSSDDDEDREELTEITRGCERKGNVLKTFSNTKMYRSCDEFESHF